MSHMLQVTDRIEADHTILNITGTFKFSARKPFLTAIEQAKHSNPRKMTINFSGVQYIDSAALGMLIIAHKNLEEASIHLTLEVPEGYVNDVFSLTKMGQRIPIVPIEKTSTTPLPRPIPPAPKAPLRPPLVFESTEMQERLSPILDMLEKKTFDLPVLPKIGARVLALTKDPDATVDQLTTIIQQDPVLTAKIFQLTSSAAYAPCKQIETIPQAIAWLGLNTVTGLAFALCVQSGVFNDRGYEQEVRAIWTHAMATAFYAKSLASSIGKNQDTAFLCGLLHSIGKLVVVHAVNQSRPPSTTPIPWSGMLTLIDQSYVEIGGQLADLWNFPAPVKEAIHLHQHFSYHLAIDSSKGAALTCLARHLATYHLDSVALSPETLHALPVTAALQLPHDVMDTILTTKRTIQTQIDSLLI